MVDTNDQEKRHRGSSPPFQGVGNGMHKIEISFASNDQGRERALSAQLVMPFVTEQNHASYANNDSRSNNEGNSRSDKNDVSRWQDDGGESGENV